MWHEVLRWMDGIAGLVVGALIWFWILLGLAYLFVGA
jgi:hypothetical protein